ncbi:hypothetical protein ABPG74_018730 [Tetrahymena malaccensis]
MSIRITEQYQKIASKSGSTMYRIYNMDIISRMVDSPLESPQTNEGTDEKNSNRCEYRLLNFFDPSQYFFDTFGDQLHSQPNQNLSKLTKTGGKAFKKMNQKKKNLMQFAQLNQHLHKNIDSQGENSNQSDHSAISINKKISKIDNQKFINKQRNHLKSNEYQNFAIYNSQLTPFKGFYVPLIDSSISNGTTTHIFHNGDARVYETSKQALKNSNQENEAYEQYKKLSISTSSQTNCQNQKIERSQQMNATKREEGEESEEISIQVDCDENGQIANSNKSETVNLNKIKNNGNQASIETLCNNQLQRNNNVKIEHQSQKNIQNQSNFPSQQMQSLQLWQIEQDRKLFLNNQQLANRDFQSSFPQGQFQNQFLKIQIHRDGNLNDNELGQNRMINNHLQMVNNAPNMMVHQLNAQNSLLMQNNINNNSNSDSMNENNNIHNSELFKQLSLEYKMIPKNNTLKNIKKAFIRYLLKTSRKQLIKKCEQFNLEVGYILTNICQEIKYDHRHNKNIRFLLKSELISPLFKDFLENSEDYWFSNSSLLNPGPCRQMVQLLIKLSQNDSLVDVIQEYEK